MPEHSGKQINATLIGIAIRPPKSRDIRELHSVHISPETGVQGDKRNRPGKRQITLMAQAAWHKACEALGQSLPWTTRRANLLVDDLPLQNSIGAQIQIGDVLLEVTGETDPCKLMEEAQAGLMEALKPEWRGGVTCRVLRGGELRIQSDVVFSSVD